MRSFVILAGALLLGMCQAWRYCSNTKQPEKCIPCEDNVPYGYKCPRQCGYERNLNLCDRVCSDHCVNSECEYKDKESLTCLHGCEKMYTGSYCQQFCMEGCVNCTQDGIRCLECEQGQYGATCAQKCNNCKNNVCDMTGNCKTGCKSGYYGNKCEKRCERCGQCDTGTAECQICNETDGTCKHGCSYGFYGRRCDKKCMSNCIQCHVQTGDCHQCAVGWFGKNCSKKCQNCRNNRCSFGNGDCTEGCKHGFSLINGICKKAVTMKQEASTTEISEVHEEEKTHTAYFEAVADPEENGTSRDYLLPAILCLLVFCAGSAVVGIWRIIRSRRSHHVNQKDEVRNELAHDDSDKTTKASLPSAPLYDEIPEDRASQHSQKLLDPQRPPLLIPPERPCQLNWCRTPFPSMQYMTPVDEDPTEGNGLCASNDRTFSFEPQACSERNNEQVSSHWRASGIAAEDPAKCLSGTFDGNGKTDLVFENETGTSLGHLHAATESVTIQGGRRQVIREYEIPAEYLDTSHSGRSTPQFLDSYQDNPHKVMPRT